MLLDGNADQVHETMWLCGKRLLATLTRMVIVVSDRVSLCSAKVRCYATVLVQTKKAVRIPVPAHIMKKTNDGKIMGWIPHNLRSERSPVSFPIVKTTPSKPPTVPAPVREDALSKKRKASSQSPEGEPKKKNPKTNTNTSERSSLASHLPGASNTQNRVDPQAASQIRASILVLVKNCEAVEQALGSQQTGSDQREEMQELKDQIEVLRMAAQGSKERVDKLQDRLHSEIQKNKDLTNLYNELEKQRSE